MHWDTSTKLALELLTNAQSRNLPLKATTKGKIYELLSVGALDSRLRPLGLQRVQIVGKSGDRGVDLVGEWKSAKTSRSLGILIQCKSGPGKINSAIWRELGGVASQCLTHSKEPNLVGLVSHSPMTRQAHVEFTSSDHPFVHFLLQFPNRDAQPHNIESVLLNQTGIELLQLHGINISQLQANSIKWV